MEASPQICQINTTQPTSNWMLLQFSKRRQRWSFDFSRCFIFPLSSTHPSTQPPSRPASHQPLPRSSLDEDPKKGKVEKSVSLFFFSRMNVQISSNSVFHLKPTSFPNPWGVICSQSKDRSFLPSLEARRLWVLPPSVKFVEFVTAYVIVKDNCVIRSQKMRVSERWSARTMNSACNLDMNTVNCYFPSRTRREIIRRSLIHLMMSSR